MPRGGRRPNAGRKGLSPSDDQYCYERLPQLSQEHFPARERRAFLRRVRAREARDADESLFDELLGHYEDLRRMPAEERSDYLARYLKNPPGTSAVHDLLKNWTRRGLKVPGPTKVELGSFHQQIAGEMSVRLGRVVSRRQVAEACRRGYRAAVVLSNEVDRLRDKQPDSIQGKEFAKCLDKALEKPKPHTE